MLFPVAITFFVTWWFIQFVDGFFSPLYRQLGVDIFGKFSFENIPLSYNKVLSIYREPEMHVITYDLSKISEYIELTLAG